MVDLARETAISISGVARRYEVSIATVYRWFGRGLERVKLGGKVLTTLEALNRFGNHHGSNGLPSDRESVAALKELRERFGITVEGRKDGKVKKQACQEVSAVSPCRSKSRTV